MSHCYHIGHFLKQWKNYPEFTCRVVIMQYLALMADFFEKYSNGKINNGYDK